MPYIFHAFFKNASRRVKDTSIFSKERAKIITWIKQALQDENLILYEGWGSKKKRYDHNTRRLCLVTSDGYFIFIPLRCYSLPLSIL